MTVQPQVGRRRSTTPHHITDVGIELFGGGFAGPLLITCFMAYVLVGHRGIYGGHRIHTPKGQNPTP